MIDAIQPNRDPVCQAPLELTLPALFAHIEALQQEAFENLSSLATYLPPPLGTYLNHVINSSDPLLLVNQIFHSEDVCINCLAGLILLGKDIEAKKTWGYIKRSKDPQHNHAPAIAFTATAGKLHTLVFSKHLGKGVSKKVNLYTSLYDGKSYALIVEKGDPQYNIHLEHGRMLMLSSLESPYLATKLFTSVFSLPCKKREIKNAYFMEAFEQTAEGLQNEANGMNLLACLHQVTLALLEMHAVGLYHFDVKEENIFRSGDRFALGDFSSVRKNGDIYALQNDAGLMFPPEIEKDMILIASKEIDYWRLGLMAAALVLPRDPGITKLLISAVSKLKNQSHIDLQMACLKADIERLPFPTSERLIRSRLIDFASDLLRINPAERKIRFTHLTLFPFYTAPTAAAPHQCNK